MYIQETFINSTEGYQLGETPLYEAWTSEQGELFRAFQKEYGRCTGKVYVDRYGKRVPVGWTFERVIHEENAYSVKVWVREVWVVLHRERPTYVATFHYEEVGR